MTGDLTAIIGPMFSGKTTRLIEAYDRLKDGGRNPVIFKPAIDSRYGIDSVGSHNHIHRPAINLAPGDYFGAFMESGATDVLIDEAQFFQEQIVEAVEMTRTAGKDVYFSALNQNFRGEPFKFPESNRNIGDLIARADMVMSLTAICHTCQSPATRTYRTSTEKTEVLVGGKAEYQARCNDHFVYEAN